MHVEFQMLISNISSNKTFISLKLDITFEVKKTSSSYNPKQCPHDHPIVTANVAAMASTKPARILTRALKISSIA